MVEDEKAKTSAGKDSSGSDTASLAKKLFKHRDPPAEQNPPEAPQKGVAHVPSSILTVEYVDDSEGMDSALKQTRERLEKLEEQLGALQETMSKLISTINQQAKELARYVDSVGRRVDTLYKRVTGGSTSVVSHGEKPTQTEAAQAEQPAPEAEPQLQLDSPPLPPQLEEDANHRTAWRIARVLAADLEAYHEKAVKEGVLYGTFFELLAEPIEKARKTYEQRVSRQVLSEYDYFTKALHELIARKKAELEAESAS